MSVFKDLTGQRFGRLAVIGRAENKTYLSGAIEVRWNCLCDCGKSINTSSGPLISGSSKSCGCLQRDIAKSKYADIAGKTFGCITAISPTGRTKHGSKEWKCSCSCGNVVYASENELQSGHTISCGCVNREKSERRFEEFMKADIVGGTSLYKIDVNKPMQKNNKSGVRGVWWNSRKRKWEAEIKISGEKHRLGAFSKLEDAAKARKLAEEQYFEPILERYKAETAG